MDQSKTQQRATHMKYFLPLLAATLLFAGCSGEKKQRLVIYNWSEYISDDVLKAFEEKHNCKVVIDNFDSNEAMYAKLKAGGTGYDITVPSSFQVSKMRTEGMLLPLDHSKIPNLKNIDPGTERFSEDPKHEYSVPYLFTTTGIGYLKDKASNVTPSWSVFAGTEYAGRMTLLDDMRETLGAALKALGHSLNTVNPEEINAARDLVISWKKNSAKFESIQYKNGLASAEFLVVHGYSSDIIQAIEDNEQIAYVIPQEGFSLALDEMVVLKNAPNPDLAHAFLNFMLDPEQSAANMEYVQAMSPNVPARQLLSPEFRDNPGIFPPAELLAKAEVIRDLGDSEQLYMKAWDEVKSAP